MYHKNSWDIKDIEHLGLISSCRIWRYLFWSFPFVRYLGLSFSCLLGSHWLFFSVWAHITCRTEERQYGKCAISEVEDCMKWMAESFGEMPKLPWAKDLIIWSIPDFHLQSGYPALCHVEWLVETQTYHVSHLCTLNQCYFATWNVIFYIAYLLQRAKIFHHLFNVCLKPQNTEPWSL